MDRKGYWRTGFSPNVTIIKPARHVKALLSRYTLVHLICLRFCTLLKKPVESSEVCSVREEYKSCGYLMFEMDHLYGASFCMVDAKTSVRSLLILKQSLHSKVWNLHFEWSKHDYIECLWYPLLFDFG